MSWSSNIVSSGAPGEEGKGHQSKVPNGTRARVAQWIRGGSLPHEQAASCCWPPNQDEGNLFDNARRSLLLQNLGRLGEIWLRHQCSLPWYPIFWCSGLCKGLGQGCGMDMVKRASKLVRSMARLLSKGDVVPLLRPPTRKAINKKTGLTFHMSHRPKPGPVLAVSSLECNGRDGLHFPQPGAA